MIKSRIAAAAALLAVAGAAQADVSVNAAWVSEYDWRGIQQTQGHDALQLSGTYTHDSGFYAGLWGSSLISNAEIDVFAGYAGDIGDSGLGFDVGLNYYTYTNTGTSDANFLEAYAGLSYGVFSGKLWYSPEFGGNGGDPAFYVEGNAALPLGDSGLNLLAHVGYSTGDGIELYYGGDDSYVDWSAGIGYDVGNFSTFVKWVDGSDVGGGGNNQLARVVFGISTTLPWGE
ncbi:MAG: TorF family putative porin [Pseudomonadota bacterium]|nr:TorF family putative porin [Pseudomonadota bacterium]